MSAPDIAAATARKAFGDTHAAVPPRAQIDVILATRIFEDSTPTRPTFGKSSNFPRSVARRLQIAPRLAIWQRAGGDTPQYLVSELCGRIAEGESRMGLIVGAEAISTVRHFKSKGDTLDWAETVDGQAEDRGPGVQGMISGY